MKLSVLVMTYNHEKYIAQALDSVLMQKVNFDYEIIISEDCSTDNTRKIILDYKTKHPEKIQLLLSEENLHNNRIVTRGFEAAKGDCIALLDGDDYWSSDEKLQLQTEFLDNHPECSVCFHNAAVFYENENQTRGNWTPPHQKKFSTFDDIWMGNFIATCSIMYRKNLVPEIPFWYYDMFPITDWPLHILYAEKGLIGYLDKVMGIYRIHDGGMYSPFSESRKLLETLNFYKTMNRNLNFKYDKMVGKIIFKFFFEWAEEYQNREDLFNARKCLQAAFNGKFINGYIPVNKIIKTCALLYFPFSSKFLKSDV